MSLSVAEQRTLEALSSAVLPAGRLLPGAGAETTRRALAMLAALPEGVQAGYRALLVALELSALARGARFSALPLGARVAWLESWEGTEASRLGLRGLLSLIKLAYFEDPAVYAALGCRYSVAPPQGRERARFRERITAAASLGPDATLECDVVVVGTGAGGAPMAKALADRGLAVLMIEEGEYFDRSAFTGRPMEMIQKLYRRSGVTVALGNTAIPIPLGKGVGGTTLINSGTCFRAPDQTLDHWRYELGLPDLSAAELSPYYAEVERVLAVGPSSRAALGKPAEVIARGAEQLGWSHHPLLRNAPGCDGQGLCCFGCPTDAKRSTNVSFVPLALERGAKLLTGLRVDRVLTREGAAVGVSGLAGSSRVTVRSKAVVLACGTIGTPLLLGKNRLANRSGELGQNLSIHPASAAMGLFAEPIHAANTVPQGYAVDEFKEEGIMFEGSSVPLDVTALSLTGFGPSYVSLLEEFNRSLQFGFMIKDVSRGSVTATASGEARIHYWLQRSDLEKMQRALGLLGDLFFASGAREVVAPVAGHERWRSRADLERFRSARISARQLDITAYHPLGTARMGVDPLRSVVDSTHETWDVHNLFIADGSVVPSSLGVNPQLTIMAMALRAAEQVARRVERLDRAMVATA